MTPGALKLTGVGLALVLLLVLGAAGGAWLAASDKAHYLVLTDAKINQARLRDRLATADLRLSVLLDSTTANGSGGMQATPSAVSVVHGAYRAQLDPANAQRIIGITSEGDQGLIALQACQSYARKMSESKYL